MFFVFLHQNRSLFFREHLSAGMLRDTKGGGKNICYVLNIISAFILADIGCASRELQHGCETQVSQAHSCAVASAAVQIQRVTGCAPQQTPKNVLH